MRPAQDVADLVTFAVEAERAGLDAVMVSEHVVLGGAVVSVASVAALRASAEMGGYAVTKAGLVMLTQSLVPARGRPRLLRWPPWWPGCSRTRRPTSTGR